MPKPRGRIPYRPDKLVEDWAKSQVLSHRMNPKSVDNYKHYLNGLLEAAEMTGVEVVERAKADPNATHLKSKESVENAKLPLTTKGQYVTLHAARRFLRDKGILNLPQDHLETPKHVKPTVVISWNDALAICGTCSKPYNSILKLMLFNALNPIPSLQRGTELEGRQNLPGS